MRFEAAKAVERAPKSLVYSIPPNCGSAVRKRKVEAQPDVAETTPPKPQRKKAKKANQASSVCLTEDKVLAMLEAKYKSMMQAVLVSLGCTTNLIQRRTSEYQGTSVGPPPLPVHIGTV